MKKYLFIPILLFTVNAYAVPDNSMSITPAASDAAVIEASDENTRNSEVSTKFNAHGHRDITSVGNTLSLGDGTTGNKTIEANNADGTKPFVRWDDTNNRWVSSRDGSNIESFVVVTGSTGGKFIMPESPTNGNHLVYRSASDTWVAENLNLDTTSIADSDGDTGIETERTSDDDIIYMKNAGTDSVIINASGEMTKPTQPAFSVENSGGQDNIATGGVTIVFGTEVFDIGGNFATNTFTAPVTGKYHLNVYTLMANVDQAADNYSLSVITSNRTYTVTIDPGQFAGDITGQWTMGIGILADMDENDTVTIQMDQSTGTAQTDLQSSKFTGFLAT